MESKIESSPIVIVESPFSGEIQRNVAYGQRAMTHAREQGETVIMPHLLWTQHPLAPHYFVSDYDTKYDVKNGGRDISLRQIHKLRQIADKVVFYTDYGMSSGMQDGMDQCVKENIPYEVRTIGQDPMDVRMGNARVGNHMDQYGRTLEDVIEERK